MMARREPDSPVPGMPGWEALYIHAPACCTANCRRRVVVTFRHRGTGAMGTGHCGHWHRSAARLEVCARKLANRFGLKDWRAGLARRGPDALEVGWYYRLPGRTKRWLLSAVHDDGSVTIGRAGRCVRLDAQTAKCLRRVL